VEILLKSILSYIKKSIYSLNIMPNFVMLQKWSYVTEIANIYVMFKLNTFIKKLANIFHEQLLNDMYYFRVLDTAFNRSK
jgi:hypothetical protein